VAEFLDLERVKPNTLGNTRMLLRLLQGRENEHRRCRRDDTSPAGVPSAAGPRRGPRYVERPRGADSAADSLRRLPRRRGDVPA